MKATGLMIGDLFRVNKDVSFKKGTIVVIRGIDADRTFRELKGCATCVAFGDSDNMQGGVWLDYLDPIPLTPEILKKNGFKREGGASYWHEGDRDACIIHWSKDKEQLVIGSPCDDCMVKMDVRYVHQLQHALRLCGIEKEIEL